MSTNNQRAVHFGRTHPVSPVAARRSQRLRLVLEYLRSHDRLVEAATAALDRLDPDLRVDQGVRS
jgi:hypothetical protein